MYNQVATLWIQQDSNSSDSYYPLDHSQPALECIYPTSSSGTEFFCEILHLQLKQIPMKYVKHQPERSIFFACLDDSEFRLQSR